MKISVIALIMSVTVTAAASDLDPVPPEILASETCQEHIVSDAKMTAADLPKNARGKEYNAYVVVSYQLDGTGKAVNPQLIDAKPKRMFEKTTISLLERTAFAPGVIKDSCTYVRTYSAMRRGR